MKTNQNPFNLPRSYASQAKRLNRYGKLVKIIAPSLRKAAICLGVDVATLSRRLSGKVELSREAELAAELLANDSSKRTN